MGDTETCVYQLVCDKNDNYETKIVQYFIMHGLGLCVKVDNYVVHIFYDWSLSHNTEVPIAIKRTNVFFP